MRVGSPAILAQAVNSLSNLLVAIFVARTLGPSAFGQFALLFALITTATAIQTAWVGDTLTVLDRGQVSIRRGINVSQLAITSISGLAAFGVAFSLLSLSALGSLAFAALVAAWLLEEYGRRVFMARLEFYKQAANDGLYLAVSLLLLSIMAALNTITLTTVLLCMAAAAFAAFVAAAFVLPSHERLGLRGIDGAGLAEVTRFGFWRGMQAGAGTMSNAVVRWLVISLASAPTLGNIEAARLLIAPLFTLFAASTNLMLPVFNRLAHGSLLEARRAMNVAALALLGTATVYGALVLVAPSVAVHVLVGSRFHPGRVLIVGWLAVASIVGLSNPSGTMAVVTQRSASVFWRRICGSMLGLVAAVVALRMAQPSWIPLCLALGAALSGVLVWRLAGNWLNGVRAE